MRAKMWRLASVSLLLGLPQHLAEDAAEGAGVASAITTTTTTLAHDVLVAQSRGRHLSQLATTEHDFRVGVWLYGQYIDGVPGVDSAVSCAAACQADYHCYHWNFHVVSHRCDLRKRSGGFNEDSVDYISGHSNRYNVTKYGQEHVNPAADADSDEL
eukprot:TRINITY_DN73812_c0_g1_i1.p1 TRINITY_DN73812_c0_g1~~TRINITY_DN73812_c0_g1_i1.p1  ORF type:complete len:167 (+),score=20.74 TRINITY_DN73812_c0_g1_i1:33-503(+)